MFKAFKNIDKVIKEKKIHVEYPRGYANWRRRFNDEYAKTKDVGKALDNIHGQEKKEGDR
jgi:hypothetical protein